MTDRKALSHDATVVLVGHFLMGSKASLTYFAYGGENKMTARGKEAFDELIEAGLITSQPYNDMGKILLKGTAEGKEWLRSMGHEAISSLMQEEHAGFATFEAAAENGA